MIAQNPIGLFAQMQGAGEAGENLFIEHCVKANYATVSIMDNFGLCKRLKDRLPNCVVVYRDSNFEPAPRYDNRQTIRDYLSHLEQDKRIVIMVNCEQGFSADRVTMWSEMLAAASDLGWHLCVGNTSSGSVRSGQGTDTNEWLTIGAPLLKALIANPGHYLGYHEYTSVFPWLVTNGGWGDPRKAPVVDWTKPQWHLGRNIQGITDACKSLGIEMPFMIVTEGIFDQMNDTQNNPDNPYHGINSNRWRMLVDKWKEWYSGRESEAVLADLCQWTWEHLYKPCGKVVGIHFFTYLSPPLANGQWSGDDVANAPIYLQRMETYHPSPTIPPVVLTPVPKPTATGDGKRVESLNDYNLRTGDGAKYPLVHSTVGTTGEAGDLLRIYPDAKKINDDGTWVYATVLNGVNKGLPGWLLLTTFEYVERPETTEVPEVEATNYMVVIKARGLTKVQAEAIMKLFPSVEVSIAQESAA